MSFVNIPSSSSSTSPCLELAIEGERLCREGKLGNGIVCFHSALSNGTDDLRCLSAIYCQLGNAYFCHRNYVQALEYHRWDLTLARRTNDTAGEAQACGNLGNTLKMLGKYDEAVVCFHRQLEIARKLSNSAMEARALYNLGNVYHAKGKQFARSTGQSDPGEYPTEAAEAQRQAIDYYTQNLALAEELRDRPAQGRVYGNLGNAHYLLGNFHEAIRCHQERLNFANEFGDLAAERRAHSNLGNAFIFLADFNTAADHYRLALRLAQQLQDIAVEAQTCYSLGNTYTLLCDAARAVVYLLRHLVIARRLGDRVGEGRAHWSLTNAYTALGRYDLAARCARRHRRLARELNDDTGLMTAQLMMREIERLKTTTTTASHHHHPTPGHVGTGSSVAKPTSVTSSPTAAATPVTDLELSTGVSSDACSPTSSGDTRVVQSTLIGGGGGGGAGLVQTVGVGMDDGEGEEEDEDEDDNDVELDLDLERELMQTAADVLDTVQVVTVGEDGRTTTTRLGVLDFPETHQDAASSEAKRENMANFYSSAPAFRRHSTHPIDPNSVDRFGDLEDELETIGPIRRATLSPPHVGTNGNRATSLSSPSTLALIGDHVDELSDGSPLVSAVPATNEEEEQAEDPQEFFYSLLLDSQSRRMDEQRCCLRNTDGVNSLATVTSRVPRPAERAVAGAGAVSHPTVVVDGGVGVTAANEALFDLIEGVQGDRMNDQRATLTAFPGLRAGPGLHLFEVGATGSLAGTGMLTSVGSGASDGLPEPTNDPIAQARSQLTRSLPHASARATIGPRTELDDDFLDMILQLQTSTRIEDQRSSLPDPLRRRTSANGTHEPHPTTSPLVSHNQPTLPALHRVSSNSLPYCGSSSLVPAPNLPTGAAPTVPDEDFFALIQRVQSTRLDEQRCTPPTVVSPDEVPSCDTNQQVIGEEAGVDRTADNRPRSRRGGSWRRVSSKPSTATMTTASTPSPSTHSFSSQSSSCTPTTSGC